MQSKIESLVKIILQKKSNNECIDTSYEEKEIDKLIYKKLLVSGKTFFCQNKKRGCFHLQDSALFRYLAVTTHIQITMGKSTAMTI